MMCLLLVRLGSLKLRGSDYTLPLATSATGFYYFPAVATPSPDHHQVVETTTKDMSRTGKRLADIKSMRLHSAMTVVHLDALAQILNF